MRLRTLLATAVASTLVAGVTGTTALAASVPSPVKAGTVVAWGNTTNPDANAALAVPTDLSAPVAKIAVNGRATAAVTTDGHLRVWGASTAPEVTQAPTNITNAATVVLAMGSAAVLHTDGKVSAWGSSVGLSDVPTDLRAKAIAITASGTGYAVRTDGTLAMWGTPPLVPMPTTGLNNLVDVSANNFQVMALHNNGTVTAWGYEDEESGITGFNTVPNLDGKKVTQIATGNFTNGLVLEDGTIKIWGPIPIAGDPDFDGKKVIDLDLSTIAGAVTEDGVVHTWGTVAAVNTIPTPLTGQPIANVAVGTQHAAVIVTEFRALTTPNITGTPQAGKTLTATPATFSLTPDSAATGQWYTGNTAITGQTGTTLTLDTALVGKKISYRTTATRGTVTLTSASTETSPVTAAPIVKSNAKIKTKIKKTGKTKKVTKKVKIAITIKTKKGITPTGKVTLTLKGKTKKKTTAKINKKGKATITIKNVKHGKYKAKLKYTGNTHINPTHTTKKFKA